jgi:two-component system response regulator AtoC
MLPRSQMADDTAQTQPARRTAQSPTALRLVVISDRGVTHWPLAPRHEVIIGRGAQADIPLDDPLASRAHAALRVEGAVVTLRDLGSSNGTRVDERALRAEETVTLRRGEVVEIGQTVITLQGGAASPPEPIAPRPARPAGEAQPSEYRRDVVVASPATRRLQRLIERVAPGEISVLLLGETGAGKEVFAEMLHRLSPRRDRPMLRLHCAALNPSLLESELFGHERGAFTGAVSPKVGLLESAAGGTVFLDEVGELPAAVQVTLLRVLEERRVTPVGAVRARPIDVRFIAATNRHLEGCVAAGTFREDLYFRLAGISLEVPPLRERAEEIDALARLFLEEACARARIRPTPTLDEGALRALREHRWPGNLRELRNTMERAALFATDGVLRAEHIAAAPSRAAPAKPVATGLQGARQAAEKEEILAALSACAGNQTRAAARLGISRRTLVDRLTAYGITRPRK